MNNLLVPAPMLGRIIAILLGLVLTAASAPPPAPPDAPPAEEEPARVVVTVNRTLEVKGFVEYEDHDVIVLRTVKGDLESFPKARVLRIVRLVDPQPGQKGVVMLRNGQVRTGVIIEDTFDHVLIEIEGIRARLARTAVDHVRLEPTFEERYARLKANLKPNMDEEYLSLCQWLMEQRRYELARDELQTLLEHSDMPQAHRLLKIVNAQIALLEKPEPSSAPDARGGSESADLQDDTGRVYGDDLLPDEIISSEDVNIIRVYEIAFDEPPKVTVKPDTIRTLIETYATSPLIPASQTERTAMFRADPIDLVRLMFELRARELYPQIEVLSEPQALNMFRLRVHDTWLMNNCATSRCHGGVGAGRLFLHRRHYKDERVRYTNLLILERLELDSQWPLINYDEPNMSLIIQHGLPRTEARLPHPDV
ncbi:MAG: hypothetical protein ACYSTY_07445, partial [Planctomycetota bacterium]